MTVETRKFSQFVAGGQIVAADMPVGLETGANTIWTGASGGGGNSETLPQPTPPVAAGQWLKITPTSGIYTGAQGDNVADAETVGLVVAANATTFTIQQSGYVTTAMAVPGISGLTPGMDYFLDTNSAGVMVPNDATVNGTVSRPVFLADSPTSGWILPYRGLVVGGAAPNSPGASNTSLVTVNQMSHGFPVGTVVRVNTVVTAASPVSYVRAQANTLQNAQSAGVVVMNPPPTTNQFTLQFDGYNVGSLTMDYLGNPLTPSIPYYLSATNPGFVTSIDPGLSGAFSRPVYIAEQATANLGINAGYILPQRPLTNANGPVNGSNLLLTQTATNQAILTFNNIFSATYNNYQIVWSNLVPSSQSPLSSLIAQIGIGAGPTYQTTNYSGTLYVINNTGLVAGAALTSGFNLGSPQYSISQYAGCGSMLLTNVNSTSSYKTMQWDSSAPDPQFATTVRTGGAQSWAGLTALTSIQFFFSTSNILSGTFSIYGLAQ